MSSRPLDFSRILSAHSPESRNASVVREIQANWNSNDSPSPTVAPVPVEAWDTLSSSSPPHAARISKNMPNKIGIANYRSVFIELLLSA